LAANERDRCAFLRSRFCEVERATLELEPGKHDLGSESQLGSWLTPPKPSGDHQVNDEKHLLLPGPRPLVESDHDALPDTADFADHLVLNGIQRRIDRSQHEWTEQP